MNHDSKTSLILIVILLFLTACQDEESNLPTTLPTVVTIEPTATSTPIPEATIQPTETEQPTVAATTPPTPNAPTETAVSTPTSSIVDEIIPQLEGLPLDQFFEESYKQLLLRSPETITYFGLAQEYDIRDDQLDDISDAYIRETQQLETAVLELLHTYNQDDFTPEQQISYDVYQWYLENQVRGHEFMYHNYLLYHFYGSYNFSLNQLFTETHPLATEENVEDYISRLSKVDEQVAQLLEGLTIRTEMGIQPPRFILEMTRRSILDNLQIQTTNERVNGRSLPIYQRMNESLNDIDTLDAAQKEAYREATLTEIENAFIPAHFTLIQAVDDAYTNAANDAGVWQFADGDEYYTHLLQQETSTTLTPDEIHQIGLLEIERIQGEMAVIFTELGYPTGEPIGDLINRAMVDGGFYATSSKSNQDQVVADLDVIVADVAQRLETVLDNQPQAEVIIVGDTAFSGGGYYESAALDGSRSASYHAGVGGSQLPKFNLRTIAYHEAIPGHHTQIATAQELTLPTFRNLLFFNAYGEGWALYSERLAFELGALEGDPYSNIGRLQLELLRAIRLVVDTGIHAKDWTRTESRTYMTENLGSWTHEVERYVAWPAQSTGYMVGMLKILELRQKSEDALGDDFDIKEFHNVVLNNGSLPLEILEQLVDEYIESKQ